MTRRDVFISHASRDREWVAVLEHNLRCFGLSAFRDQSGIAVGDAWIKTLQENIDAAEKIVLVITPGSMASGWVTGEWQTFLARMEGRIEGRLFAVELFPADLPAFLRPAQVLDLSSRTPDEYLAGLRALVAGLKNRASDDPPDLPGDLRVPDSWPSYLVARLREQVVELTSASCTKVPMRRDLATLLGLPKDALFGYTTPRLAASAALERVPGQATPRGAALRLLDVLVEGEFVEAGTGEYEQLKALRQAIQALDDGDAPDDDLAPYFDRVIAEHGRLHIAGIGTGHGRTKAALHPPIEQIYTELTVRRPLRDAPGEPEGLRTAGEPVHLATILPEHARLLIEGRPGAGKTTFVRLVCCLLARDRRGVPCPDADSWCARYLGLRGPRASKIPVLLRVDGLVDLLADKPRAGDNRLRLLDLIEAYCAHNEIAVPRTRWQALLDAGDVWLLLDGLDEVADEDTRERVFAIFDDACSKWRDCPITVTSRPISTDHLRRTHGFDHVVIESFDRPQIEAFVDRWVDALYERAPGTERTRDAAEYAAALDRAILHRSAILRLAENPVMLTCLCIVHWNEGRLPDGRPRVYAAVLRWLLEQRKDQRAHAGYEDRFAHRAFAQLALAMMRTEGGKRVTFDLEDGARAICAALERFYPDDDDAERRRRGRKWLMFECMGSGIIEELPGQKVRFWHLTFQEYLAAYELALGNDDLDAPDTWWPDVRDNLENAQWRETIDIFPGCLFDEGGEGRVDKLFERVLAVEREEWTGELARDAGRAGLIGRLLQSLDVYGYKARPAVQQEYERALESSMMMFTAEGALRVPVEVRIAAAEALGRAGDPRLTPERWEGNMLEVPGCAGLRLGRYLVTVEEFQRFLDDRGYEREDFWGDGWSIKSEAGWSEPGSWAEQLEHPNRPVVEVSWYEAAAYCAWLGALRQCDVRLPSFAEGDRAATQPEGHYPWGDPEPDSERANFGNNVRAPTPVGIYPAGVGPYGHDDLGGNVWEWCGDRHSDGDPYLRGGAWVGPPEDLRSGVRSRFRAGYRSHGFGFRVALSPAST